MSYLPISHDIISFTNMQSSKWFKQQVKLLKKQGLYNELKIINSSISSEIKINNKKYLNFSSNNYLGLADDKRVKKAAIKAIKKYGVGPGAVRTIAGTTVLHRELEDRLAKFKRAEAVITYQSGFNANIAVIPAIAVAGDVIFSDELNHASIIDGVRLSKAQVVRFKHSDMADLESKIRERHPALDAGSKGIIITDGVFSMDGDTANLPEIARLAKKYNLLTLVDDAHGEGVLGDHGRGIVDHYNLHGKIDIEIGTLSKAFGVVGGFVAGRKEIIKYLTQRSRPFLFSSALTIPDTAASIEAVKILSKSDKLVKRLWQNAKYMKAELVRLGFDTGNSSTPIIPVIIGDEKEAVEFSERLFKNGLFAKAVAYPTVPLGTARVRVMNSASHSQKDLERAIKIFEKSK